MRRIDMRGKRGSVSVLQAAVALMLGLFVSGAFAQDLVEAVKAGDLAKVKTIVERDPKIINNPSASGETILFAAIAARQPAIIEYFVAKGADVNVRTNSLMTPLLAACRRNLSLDSIKLLVEKGADVNAASKYQGRPLDIAQENGDEAVVRYLTSKGAAFTPPDFETVKFSAHIHRLAYPWGMRNNLVVFDGPDGLIVLDSGFNKRVLPAFKTIVAGFAKGDIRYVINSHDHWDHVAGNETLAPSAAAIIGAGRLDHADLKNVLSKSASPLSGRSGRSLPAPYVMKFNGEDIDLIPYPGLHSPADLLIHFPKSGIVYMGDLLLSQSCPAIGDAAGYLEFLDKVLDVFPSGTIYVSGHGRDLKPAELKKYRDDMAAMIDVVKTAYASGKTAEDMIQADLLKTFKPAYSHLDWLGPDSWIRTIVRNLASGSLK
jgi:cyclase